MTTFSEVVRVVVRKSEEISWLSSEHEAKYWWDELENFQIECWETIKDNCSLETLREFTIKVDELTVKYGLDFTAQAIIGAALIKRFIHSRYSTIKPEHFEICNVEKADKEVR